MIGPISYKLSVRMIGREECAASLESLAEAMGNACLDFADCGIDTDGSGGGFFANGLKIVKAESQGHEALLDGIVFVVKLRPTPAMILFVGLVMARLPDTARVEWRGGWPHFHCPPRDDRDGEDEPTPLVPDNLVTA